MLPVLHTSVLYDSQVSPKNMVDPQLKSLKYKYQYLRVQAPLLYPNN